MVGQFILAMIQHPEAQKKAQAELDAVVGLDRLPTFADRPSLPYSTLWNNPTLIPIAN